MKRKIIIIASSLVVLLLSFFFYLNNQKYSISEINADNYLVLLNRDMNQSLTNRGVGLSQVIKIPVILVEPRAIRNIEGYKISEIDYFDTPSGVYVLNFNNLFDNTTYGIEFKNKSSEIITGVEISNWFGGGISGGEQIIQRLLTKEEFIFKESMMKGRPDIIIRDLGDVFLIGSISKSENGVILYIGFRLFKTKKYFKSW